MTAKRLLRLALAALPLAGCGDAGGGGTDAGFDSGTDTDADADTDADTDTDSGADAGSDETCAGGQLDPASGLCWQDPRANEAQFWEDAIAFCDALELSGHDDWYLPSRDDFMGLLGGCVADAPDGGVDSLDGGPGEAGGGMYRCNSCAESGTCSALLGPDDHWYWSSSPGTEIVAWGANFPSGIVTESCVYYCLSVRCVRTGP